MIFVLTQHIKKHVTLLASSKTLTSAIGVAAMFALIMIGEYATKSEVWRRMYFFEDQNFSFFFLCLERK